MNSKPHRGVPGGRPDTSKEKFWREVVGRWAASGQSVRAFCHAQGLSEPSFYSWRRTLVGRGGAGASRPSPAAPAFLPVQVSGQSPAAACIEVLLAGGVRIGLRPPVDRTALREVLGALGWVPGVAEEA